MAPSVKLKSPAPTTGELISQMKVGLEKKFVLCKLQQQHVCYVNIYWLEMDHPNIDKMLNWNEKSYQNYSKNHNHVKLMFSCLLFCYIPLHYVKKEKTYDFTHLFSRVSGRQG